MGSSPTKTSFKRGFMPIDVKKVINDYDGRAITTYDIVPKIQRLLNNNYIIREDGKITPAIKSKSFSTPWIYNRCITQKCTLYHEIMFGTLGIMPSSCLDCWKVVVRPKNVKELICLLEIEETLTKRCCKCGIEVREYVSALYGGYFYNRSKEEALDCLDDVRILVSENIGPHVPVFLKRYCTEFEMSFGPSDQIEETLGRGYFIHPDQGKVPVMSVGDMRVWENIAEQLFDLDPGSSIQAPFIKQHVIRTWFDFAWSHGDMTVKEFFGGDDLYTPSIRYER